MTTAVDDVLFEEHGSSKVIVLNRPKALNALNYSMLEKIYPQLKAWSNDPDTSMILIKGSGEKAFCAGGDVKAVTDAGKKGEPLFTNFFRNEYILNYAIGTCPKPYIAFIKGITMGGGVGLSVHGKYRIATESTLFAMPETAIGLFPDVGGTYFMPRLEGALGEFLALTGHRLKGEDVHRAGIATHFVKNVLLQELEESLINLEEPTEDRIQALIDLYHSQSVSPHTFSLNPHINSINEIYSSASMEEIFSKLKLEGSEFSMKNLKLMEKMSPSSMKITLEGLRRGRSMSLQECLVMELRMTEGVKKNKDFFEGVRAVLVDKDHSPKWGPSSLEGISQQALESYFTETPEGGDLVL